MSLADFILSDGGGLSRPRTEILTMHGAGMTVEQIADATRLPEGVVRKAITRTLHRMNGELASGRHRMKRYRELGE